MIAALLACACALPLPQEVVAGSGTVTPEVLARVRSTLDDRLRALRPAFPDLAVRPFRVFVHASTADMPPALQAVLHPGSPGFALLGRHQIHVVWGELRRTGTALHTVVAHELVHELLDQHVAPHGADIPRWFHEGLAQVLAGDTYLGAREEDLYWRVGANRLLAFSDLRERFPNDEDALRTAYAQSFSYVAWLERAYGLPALLEVARAADARTTFERALAGKTGRTTLELADAWRYHLQHESGASWRILLDQCFEILMLVSLPILAVAVVRRFARERRMAERLARADAEAAARPPPPAEQHDGAP